MRAVASESPDNAFLEIIAGCICGHVGLLGLVGNRDRGLRMCGTVVWHCEVDECLQSINECVCVQECGAERGGRWCSSVEDH